MKLVHRICQRVHILYLVSALGLCGILSLLAAPHLCAADQGQTEVSNLIASVPTFHVVTLPLIGTPMTLTTSQSYTIEQLRGVAIDPAPPTFLTTPPTHAWHLTDGLTDTTRPYIAQNIQPFRLQYFHNELNFGGWYNQDMYDYLMRHGFSVLWPYGDAAPPNNFASYMPTGTTYMSWACFGWDGFMGDPNHGVAVNRYDLLMDWPANHGGQTLAQHLVSDGYFPYTAGYANYMIDTENSPLGETTLRAQSWYPSNGTPEEKAAFETKYYDGFALSQTAVAQAAYQRGWRNISIYGWQPCWPSWFALSSSSPNPNDAGNWGWLRYGQQTYRDASISIVNNSVYVPYGITELDQASTAWVLAINDLNVGLMNTETTRKPIRPYMWTNYFGSGAAWDWFCLKARTSEHVRAETAISFFTGIDGVVNWNWSETSNMHVPPTLPTNTHPTGWWKCNETSGTTASDSSGNGYAGTLMNGLTWNSNSVYACFKNCLAFDGTNDYVSLANPSGLNVNGNITLAAWINVPSDQYTGTHYIISHDDTTFLRINNGNYEVGCKLSSYEYTCSVAIPSSDANQWVHLTGVYSTTDSKWHLYKNGVDITPTSQPAVVYGAQTSSINWAIGSVGAGSGGYLKGSIDDVRIYNFALTGDAVRVAAFVYDAVSKDNFSLAPDGGGTDYQFTRYQPLHVVDIQNGNVTFQPLDRSQNVPYGLTATTPTYTLSTATFNSHVRTLSEATAAIVEGLALVKLVEYNLSHGDVKLDDPTPAQTTLLPSQEAFSAASPILRRVKYGNNNIVITYDPQAVDTGAGRTITIPNFNEHPGMDLTFPADATPRIFVLHDPAEFNANLVGYWPLEEGSGTTAYDMTSNHNDATLLNAPTWTTGHLNGGLQFNPTNAQSLQVAGSTSLSSISSGVTMACWAKSATTTWDTLSLGDFISKRNAFVFGPTAGTKQLCVYIWLAAGGYVAWYCNLPTTTDITQWHHYAATYDGDRIKIYVDGVLATTSGSIPGTINPDTGVLCIGVDDTTGRYFNGGLDEVRVYNRALTVNEVLALAQVTNVPTVTLTAPANGAAYQPGASITMTASASSTNGSISKVEFFADGVLIGTTTSAPYTYTWSGATNGTHCLTAVATDSSTGSSTSQAINITVMGSNLVGYWPLEEGSGATAYDMTSNDNDATLLNTPTWTTECMGAGEGLQFNPANAQSLQVANSTSLSSISSGVTMACWAKSATTTWDTLSIGDFISKRNAFVFGPTAGTKQLCVYIWLAAGGYVAWYYNLPTTTDITQWHHYAATYDGDRIKIYVDGVLATASGSIPGTINPDTGVLCIGVDDTTNRYFNGKIDQIRVYNNALSATELSALAQGKQ